MSIVLHIVSPSPLLYTEMKGYQAQQSFSKVISLNKKKMTNEILLGLFNNSIAIALCISLYRGRKDKVLKLNLITAPVTTVRSIVIAGKGFTFITVGWGITAILLIFSGWRAFFQTQMLEQTFLITVVCLFLILITAVIAHYLTPHSDVRKSRF